MEIVEVIVTASLGPFPAVTSVPGDVYTTIEKQGELGHPGGEASFPGSYSRYCEGWVARVEPNRDHSRVCQATVLADPRLAAIFALVDTGNCAREVPRYGAWRIHSRGEYDVRIAGRYSHVVDFWVANPWRPAQTLAMPGPCESPVCAFDEAGPFSSH